jgi:hypothetical protein
MTWSDVAVAGAFVLGVVAGGVGSIRITRYVLEYMKRDRDSGP